MAWRSLLGGALTVRRSLPRAEWSTEADEPAAEAEAGVAGLWRVLVLAVVYGCADSRAEVDEAVLAERREGGIWCGGRWSASAVVLASFTREECWSWMLTCARAAPPLPRLSHAGVPRLLLLLHLVGSFQGPALRLHARGPQHLHLLHLANKQRNPRA